MLNIVNKFCALTSFFYVVLEIRAWCVYFVCFRAHQFEAVDVLILLIVFFYRLVYLELHVIKQIDT